MAKICFYSIATQLGGAERSLLEYLRFVKQHSNEEITLVLPKNDGPLIEEARKLDISIHFLPMPEALLLGTREKFLLRQLRTIPSACFYFLDLLKYLRESQPDLIYSTGIKCHILGAMASIISGIPILWHLRDDLTGATRWILRIFYRDIFPVKAIANSRSTALALSQTRIPAVVHNGISFEDFPYERSVKLHSELKLAPTTKIVGIVGVLARWKGQLEFLSMAALLKHIPDLHFVIVGDQIYDTLSDQEYKSQLMETAKNLGLEKRVSFLGFRKDAATIIQSLDVLVHASIRPEPFGRVIIEAMASGTPITASSAGGPLEILRAGTDGLFHTPGKPGEMAKNVERLLAPNFSEKLRQSAHGRYLDLFTHTRYTSHLHFHVTEVLFNRPKSSASTPATN